MTRRAILKAIFVAGTLDILSAVALTAMAGRPVDRMLAGIAAGPFGDGVIALGLTAAMLGLVTHYALMSIMVVVFAGLIRRYPGLVHRPVAAGILYGLAIYAVMYWLVLPIRWPDTTQLFTLRAIGIPILIHITLVGLPISLILSAAGRSSRQSAVHVAASGMSSRQAPPA
ncbi:hypothetical protein [Pelagerythrobacter aerophilus]|uniref:hypothetical protein n=1 Tax=Pelagerythrobacter aerophilus TaxID=2306995 RepID=UPI0011C3DC23|nr:hypothetical protein [Pelagerythrobacter aerophilus]